MTISERARTVLSQIITLHYTTCEPVGSTLVSRTKIIPFSPATIRNIMMRLESTGHLCQPHTSAGRLPTDLGYRTYVNDLRLRRPQTLASELSALNEAVVAAPKGPATLSIIADHLHRRTNLVTFYLPFRGSALRLKHIHFERLNPSRLLVLWVSKGGYTHQTVLSVPEDRFGGPLIEKTENFLNQTFHGDNLLAIQRRLALSSGAGRGEWDLVVDKAAMICHLLSQEADQIDDVTFQGVTSLLQMPEFQNVASVRTILAMFEHQSRLKDLIRRVQNQPNEWIVYFIGGELADPELAGLAVVLAKIQDRHNVIGCVGMLGPKRMPYLKSFQFLSSAREMVAAQAL